MRELSYIVVDTCRRLRSCFETMLKSRESVWCPPIARFLRFRVFREKWIEAEHALWVCSALSSVSVAPGRVAEIRISKTERRRKSETRNSKKMKTNPLFACYLNVSEPRMQRLHPQHITSGVLEARDLKRGEKGLEEAARLTLTSKCALTPNPPGFGDAPGVDRAGGQHRSHQLDP